MFCQYLYFLSSLTLKGPSVPLGIEPLTAPNVGHVAAIVLPDADDDVYRTFEDFADRSPWPPINHLLFEWANLDSQRSFPEGTSSASVPDLWWTCVGCSVYGP